MEVNNLPILKVNRFNSDANTQARLFGVSCPNLSPLKQDTVSFKGAALKKSDFKGSDLAVIEKYKINPQQLKSKDDLQTFAEDKIRTIMLKPELSKDIATLKQVQGDDLKDFGGRREETKIQRKAMLKEWFDYVIKENDAYSNAQRLIILSAVTKELKPNNDTIPPVLNKGVLAQTATELEEKLKANPKENFDFNKMYQNNLRTNLMNDSSSGETMTGWIIILSKENDPKNFEKNVEKLKTLSHNSWCTKSFNAEPYLSQGDFHVYLENGQPKLGVRFIGDEVQEIQGEKNNGKIPQKYFDTFKEHQQEYNMQLSQHAKNEVQNAETVKVELEKVKQKLGSALEIKTIDDAIKIFDYAEIEVEKKDNMLVISEYRQPNKNGEFEYEDLGIDENKLFKFVTKINGNADFCGSKITNLRQLQSIGGVAKFKDSQITDLGQLHSIGGYVEVNDKKLFKKLFDKLDVLEGRNLHELKEAIKAKDTEKIFSAVGIKTKKDASGKLILSEYRQPFRERYYKDFDIDEENLFRNVVRIEGNAKFTGSEISNLHNLESIGGNADFCGSKITNLGQLQSIGGDAIFEGAQITDLGQLQSIGRDADFTDSQVTNLGQLQSIGGDVDFWNSQITNLGQLQSIGGNANFGYSQITNLGQLKSIGRDAKFERSEVTNLGQLQSIGGNAHFSSSQVTNLGQLKSIGRDAHFNYSQVTDLGQLQSIGRDADFTDAQVTNLGQLQSIGGNVDFWNSQITNLGQLKSIGRDAKFERSEVTNLGQLQSIGGNAHFSCSQVTNLGQLQSIGRDADFTDSQVTNLGQLQSIGGDVYMRQSKLSVNDFENVMTKKIYE